MKEAIASFITNHWLLTFIIVIWIVESFTEIVKGIIKIFTKEENYYEEN